MHPLPGGVQIPQEELQQVSPRGQRLGPHWGPRRGGMQATVLLTMTHSRPLAQSTRAQSGAGSAVGVAARDAVARRAPPRRRRKESGPMFGISDKFKIWCGKRPTPVTMNRDEYTSNPYSIWRNKKKLEMGR